jgi:hypothetical protein
MIHRKIVRVVAGVLLLQTAMAKLGENLLRSNRRLSGEENEEPVAQGRSMYTSGVGDRVSQLDVSDANCMVTTENGNQGIALTSIIYYYAIESSSEVQTSDILGLEKELDDLIAGNILWCTQDSQEVNLGDRMLSDVSEDPRCKSHRARYNYFEKFDIN